EAACILRRRADRDADPFSKLIAAHGPHDYAARLEMFEHSLAITEAHEDEVGGGKDEFESQSAKGGGKEFEAGGGIEPGFANMLGIVQGPERSRLCQRVNVERLSDFFEGCD